MSGCQGVLGDEEWQLTGMGFLSVMMKTSGAGVVVA